MNELINNYEINQLVPIDLKIFVYVHHMKTSDKTIFIIFGYINKPRKILETHLLINCAIFITFKKY